MLRLHAQFALMLSLKALFCSVDAFCQSFEPQWQQQLLGFGLQPRNRPRSLILSAIMTLLIGFHQSCYRNFKTYYQEKVRGERLNIVLTPSNTDVRTPVPKLLQQLFGKVFADKGYVSQKLAKQ
jgi:hypothetical protein